MAYRDNPTSEEFVPTAAEEAAIRQMCVQQDLSRAALMRQALRLYQLTHLRLQAGETQTWSGDAERARQFASGVHQEPEQ